MIKHAEVLENEAMNKMIDDAHDLFLLLIEHQCTEVMTRLMLIQKQIRQTWRIVWKKRFNAAHFQYLISKIIHWYLQLHKSYAKSHSALLTQLRMRKIDFNQFLHEKWVLNITITMCKCDKDQMLIKHILLTCFKWKVEWKAMQWKENITNFINISTKSLDSLWASEQSSFNTNALETYMLATRWDVCYKLAVSWVCIVD